MTSAADQNARVDVDRRDRRAAPVEHDDVRFQLHRKRSSLQDVRHRHRARKATAGPAATDRDESRERSRLEIVGSRVPAVARKVEQRLERRLHECHLRLRRSSTPHRHDDDVTIPCEQPRDMTRYGRLADAFPCTDDCQRREWKRRVLRRLEAKVGALVAETRRKDTAGDQHAFARPQHRLVRQVDDDLRIREAVLERFEQRHAVVRLSAQLLRAAREPGADHLVGQPRDRIPHDRRVVLAVDDDDRRRHRREVTSPSMRAVYFSNSSVSTANWMIFSCPWNGYLRQTSTCVPENSMML